MWPKAAHLPWVYSEMPASSAATALSAGAAASAPLAARGATASNEASSNATTARLLSDVILMTPKLPLSDVRRCHRQ